jgi:hypothetical protein
MSWQANWKCHGFLHTNRLRYCLSTCVTLYHWGVYFFLLLLECSLVPIPSKFFSFKFIQHPEMTHHFQSFQKSLFQGAYSRRHILELLVSLTVQRSFMKQNSLSPTNITLSKFSTMTCVLILVLIRMCYQPLFLSVPLLSLIGTYHCSMWKLWPLVCRLLCWAESYSMINFQHVPTPVIKITWTEIRCNNHIKNDITGLL